MQTFEKFILKKLMGPLTYNEQSAVITARMEPLSQRLREEIGKEGSKWKLSPEEVKQTIDRVQNNFTQWSSASERHAGCGAFNLNELPEGTQVNLTAFDERLNTEVVLQLLHLGRHDGASSPRLLVLSCTRTSLLPGDEVEPHADAFLSQGHALLLRVYRNGQRWPDGQRVWHVAKIKELSQLMPSALCEVADSNCSFTHDEERVLKGKAQFALGRNPMSLLLQKHSTLMPVYAEFACDESSQETRSDDYAPGYVQALTDEEAQSLFGQPRQNLTRQAQPKGTFLYAEANGKLSFLP